MILNLTDKEFAHAVPDMTILAVADPLVSAFLSIAAGHRAGGMPGHL